jgi:hypothetical protein
MLTFTGFLPFSLIMVNAGNDRRFFVKAYRIMSALLRRKAASAYLFEKFGIERAVGTLAKLATLGGGPLFRRAGRIPLYASDDLDDWALSLISGPMRSTSEVVAPSPASAVVERESPPSNVAVTAAVKPRRQRRQRPATETINPEEMT